MMLSTDPWVMLTPTAVYGGLGKRLRCGGCLTLATGIIQGCVAECRAACGAGPMSSTTLGGSESSPRIDGGSQSATISVEPAMT